MKTSTLLKFCTFFLFLLLIGIFVSYRSGAFSKDEYSGPLPISVLDTSGRGKAARPDTVPATKADSLLQSIPDSIKRTWMSSSKSIMVREPGTTPSKRKRTMMESSKLGRVIWPKDTSKNKKDTILLLKKKQ